MLQPLSSNLRKQLNLLRTNPTSLIPHLQSRRAYYRDILYFLIDKPDCAIRTTQGPRALQQLIDFLFTIQPMPALSTSPQLQKAAQEHSQDLALHGTYSHKGSDGSELAQRVERNGGKWEGSLVEVLECGYGEAREVLVNLLIDDGMPSRAHRKVLMDPHIKLEGIAAYKHKKHQCITVMVFSDWERKGEQQRERGSIFKPLHYLHSNQPSPQKHDEKHQQRTQQKRLVKHQQVTPKPPVPESVGGTPIRQIQSTYQPKPSPSPSPSPKSPERHKPTPQVVHDKITKKQQCNCLLF